MSNDQYYANLSDLEFDDPLAFLNDDDLFPPDEPQYNEMHIGTPIETPNSPLFTDFDIASHVDSQKPFPDIPFRTPVSDELYDKICRQQIFDDYPDFEDEESIMNFETDVSDVIQPPPLPPVEQNIQNHGSMSALQQTVVPTNIQRVQGKFVMDNFEPLPAGMLFGDSELVELLEKCPQFSETQGVVEMPDVGDICFPPMHPEPRDAFEPSQQQFEPEIDLKNLYCSDSDDCPCVRGKKKTKKPKIKCKNRKPKKRNLIHSFQKLSKFRREMNIARADMSRVLSGQKYRGLYNGMEIFEHPIVGASVQAMRGHYKSSKLRECLDTGIESASVSSYSQNVDSSKAKNSCLEFWLPSSYRRNCTLAAFCDFYRVDIEDRNFKFFNNVIESGRRDLSKCCENIRWVRIPTVNKYFEYEYTSTPNVEGDFQAMCDIRKIKEGENAPEGDPNFGYYPVWVYYRPMINKVGKKGIPYTASMFLMVYSKQKMIKLKIPKPVQVRPPKKKKCVSNPRKRRRKGTADNKELPKKKQAKTTFVQRYPNGFPPKEPPKMITGGPHTFRKYGNKSDGKKQTEPFNRDVRRIPRRWMAVINPSERDVEVQMRTSGRRMAKTPTLRKLR